jgi:predicted glutamine amidotransferase
MCGIIGLIQRDKEFILSDRLIKVIRNGFEINRHRGTDSYGFYGVTKNKDIVYYKDLNVENVIEELKKFRNKKFKLVFLHHRKASIGSISKELAHPIKFENILTIHNGTNRELFNKLKKENKDLQSDTQAISYLTNKLFKKYYTKNRNKKEILMKILEELEKNLNNTGVVFQLYKNQYLLFHKDNSRELHILLESNDKKLTKDIFLIASEPIMAGNWYKIKKEYELSIPVNSIDKLIPYILEQEKEFIKNHKKEIIIKNCVECGKLFAVEKQYKDYEKCKECRTYYRYSYNSYKKYNYDYYPYYSSTNIDNITFNDEEEFYFDEIENEITQRFLESLENYQDLQEKDIPYAVLRTLIEKKINDYADDTNLLRDYIEFYNIDTYEELLSILSTQPDVNTKHMIKTLVLECLWNIEEIFYNDDKISIYKLYKKVLEVSPINIPFNVFTKYLFELLKETKQQITH